MSPENPPIRQDYAIARWGEGLFHINDDGHVAVRPQPGQRDEIDLYRLGMELRTQGFSWPVLVRFTDILEQRVRQLQQAFHDASKHQGFQGAYTALYPIKVNQQRSVIEHLVAGGSGAVGLEAGSKPELMAVLSLTPPGGVVVCNGYKDREYVRLALIGRHLGLRIYLVLEKPGELELILRESASLGIPPRLGLRIRTAVAAASNWQNTGGEKAKFGFTAQQVVTLLEALRQRDALQHLHLLHAHLGSQVPDLGDIRRGMTEIARYYAELRHAGAPLTTVDVGGGLGVDYEGSHSHHYCSADYGLDEYAGAVIAELTAVCREKALPHPEVFTESGRAMTAHHAVLITNVIQRDPAPDSDDKAGDTDGAMAKEPEQLYRDAMTQLQAARQEFLDGRTGLGQRAAVEQRFYRQCRRVQQRLMETDPGAPLLDELNQKLADRLFLNFSLFQSAPDIWGVSQIFPVVPLHRLNEPAIHHAIIHDLTCDSDGRIEEYVVRDGIAHTLPVSAPHPGVPCLFGIFLVGAYQEILGDLHNLFGDTDAVNVELDGQGGYRLVEVERGDTVEELLRYLHFEPLAMLRGYRQRLLNTSLSRETAEQYFAELKAGLYGYTYHEE